MLFTTCVSLFLMEDMAVVSGRLCSTCYVSADTKAVAKLYKEVAPGLNGGFLMHQDSTMHFATLPVFRPGGSVANIQAVKFSHGDTEFLEAEAKSVVEFFKANLKLYIDSDDGSTARTSFQLDGPGIHRGHEVDLENLSESVISLGGNLSFFFRPSDGISYDQRHKIISPQVSIWDLSGQVLPISSGALEQLTFNEIVVEGLSRERILDLLFSTALLFLSLGDLIMIWSYVGVLFKRSRDSSGTRKFRYIFLLSLSLFIASIALELSAIIRLVPYHFQTILLIVSRVSRLPRPLALV